MQHDRAVISTYLYIHERTVWQFVNLCIQNHDEKCKAELSDVEI